MSPLSRSNLSTMLGRYQRPPSGLPGLPDDYPGDILEAGVADDLFGDVVPDEGDCFGTELLGQVDVLHEGSALGVAEAAGPGGLDTRCYPTRARWQLAMRLETRMSSRGGRARTDADEQGVGYLPGLLAVARGQAGAFDVHVRAIRSAAEARSRAARPDSGPWKKFSMARAAWAATYTLPWRRRSLAARQGEGRRPPPSPPRRRCGPAPSPAPGRRSPPDHVVDALEMLRR